MFIYCRILCPIKIAFKYLCKRKVLLTSGFIELNTHLEYLRRTQLQEKSEHLHSTCRFKFAYIYLKTHF